MKNIFLLIILCLKLLNPYYVYAEDYDNFKKQIGQMLIVGFRDTVIEDDSYISKAIKDLNLGGVILFDYDVPGKGFPRNIINPAQVRLLCSSLKQLSDTPLLIAIDAEGGMINRLKPKYGFIDIPSHHKLGKINDTQNTYAEISSLARQLSGLGINTNFAPVVDLNRNPDNPIIAGKERSFSEDHNIVIAHAEAFIKAHHDSNILTAVKHFPGHGSSSGDTHIGLTDVTGSYSPVELKPFEVLAEKHLVDMIMTSHIINKNCDPDYPVTLSEYYINEIIRKTFKYKGVVVSDDMQMGAITERYSFRDAIIRAVNAGCDMLVISNNGTIYDESAPYRAVDIISEAFKSGYISKDTITDSLDRIRTLKSRLRSPL